VEQLADPRVPDRVTPGGAVLPRLDDMARAEHRELLRHHRLIDTERLLQLLHAALAQDEHLEQLDAERMRQGLEEVRLERVAAGRGVSRGHDIIICEYLIIAILPIGRSRGRTMGGSGAALGLARPRPRARTDLASPHRQVLPRSVPWISRTRRKTSRFASRSAPGSSRTFRRRPSRRSSSGGNGTADSTKPGIWEWDGRSNTAVAARG